jgi:programmed cell death 6-interacting protein
MAKLMSEDINTCSRNDSQTRIRRVLRALHLPASLEALSKPIGLPPSLLRKAQEIREGNIPAVIESSVERIQEQAQKNAEILDNVSSFQGSFPILYLIA